MLKKTPCEVKIEKKITLSLSEYESSMSWREFAGQPKHSATEEKQCRIYSTMLIRPHL